MFKKHEENIHEVKLNTTHIDTKQEEHIEFKMKKNI